MANDLFREAVKAALERAGVDRMCPRCTARPLNFSNPARNARSRVDNTTWICSQCDTDEAMFEYFYPGRDLPPLDRRAIW